MAGASGAAGRRARPGQPGSKVCKGTRALRAVIDEVAATLTEEAQPVLEAITALEG